MSDKLELLKSMQVLELKPGDIVVLKYDGLLSADNQKRLGEQCRIAGITNKVIVLEHGMDIGVLRERS